MADQGCLVLNNVCDGWELGSYILILVKRKFIMWLAILPTYLLSVQKNEEQNKNTGDGMLW